jgi:hypothetical protein
MHKVDPLARQVGKSSEVFGRRESLRLETPHLTRRSRAPLRRFAADNPTHSRIVAQTLGKPSTSSSSLQAGNPASKVTRERRNWSIKRRWKSIRNHPGVVSAPLQ